MIIVPVNLSTAYGNNNDNNNNNNNNNSILKAHQLAGNDQRHRTTVKSLTRNVPKLAGTDQCPSLTDN